MNQAVKILLVDPSMIVRRGVLAVLQGLNAFKMEVVEVDEIEQLKPLLIRHKPDVVLLNPGVLGLLPLAQIKKESGNPQVKCIALQSVLTEPAVLKLFDEVISIYDSAQEIHAKLTKLVSGDRESERRYELLTAREKEIIVCVIKGMTNKQIADKLHLSSHTVISHRRNISSKLQIHTTAGLTIYAIVNKLVDLSV